MAPLSRFLSWGSQMGSHPPICVSNATFKWSGLSASKAPCCPGCWGGGTGAKRIFLERDLLTPEFMELEKQPRWAGPRTLHVQNLQNHLSLVRKAGPGPPDPLSQRHIEREPSATPTAVTALATLVVSKREAEAQRGQGLA